MSLVGMGGNQVIGKKMFIFRFLGFPQFTYCFPLTQALSTDELSPLECQISCSESIQDFVLAQSIPTSNPLI